MSDLFCQFGNLGSVPLTLSLNNSGYPFLFGEEINLLPLLGLNSSDDTVSWPLKIHCPFLDIFLRAANVLIEARYWIKFGQSQS